MNQPRSNRPSIWPYIAITVAAFVLLGLYRLIAANLLFNYEIHPALRSNVEDVVSQKILLNQLVQLGLSAGRWLLPLLVLIYSAQRLYQERATGNFVRRLLKPTLVTFGITAGIPLLILAVLYLPQGSDGVFGLWLYFFTMLRTFVALVLLALFMPVLIILAYKYSGLMRYVRVLPLVLIVGSALALSVYGVLVKAHYDSCGLHFPNVIRVGGSYTGIQCLASRAALLNDPSYCEVNPQYKNGCYDSLVGITGDESLCAKLDIDSPLQGNCYVIWLRNIGRL